jgi:hypothetical protein
MVDVSELRDRLAGTVLEHSDPGFREELAGWVTTVDQNPDIVVGAASESDIVDAVRFARERGLSVDILATGHGAEVPSGADLIITTRRLIDIEIDPTTQIATLGAGVRWREVVAVAAPYGLTPIAGASTSVGAVGFLLGGGLGPLARSHGYASDYVRGFTVVTGTGELLSIDATNNPDLFWALRGGKVRLGVVTQVRVELVALRTLYGGSLLFDAESIAPALRGWVGYTATAPADVSTSVAVMRLPDIPQVPEPIRGRIMLSLRFAYAGDATDGAQLATPLRSLGPVFLDTIGEIPATAIDTIHNDPDKPGPGWVHGRMLTSIDQTFADTLLGLVGAEQQVPFVVAEVRHLGAATRHDVEGGSAVGGRDAGFTFTLIGVPDPSLFADVLPRAAQHIVDALSPWMSPITNANFASHRTVDDPPSAAWPPHIAARLDTIRHQFDPDGVFVPSVFA